MRKATNDEIRKIQLNLLRDFDSFCVKNNIRYFAFAGTLLGAIRHKGFIPWDNDIDLAVDRSDYIKLQNLLYKTDDMLSFKFVCHELDDNYLWQHGRIIDKKTYIKTAKGDLNFGISIDIFPLDNQGSNFKKAISNLRRCHKCVELRIMSYDKKYKKWSFPKKISWIHKLNLWVSFCFLHKQSEKYWVEKHIKLAQKFSNDSRSKYYGCNSNDKYTVVGSLLDYSDTQYMPFEDTAVPVPIGYDNILHGYFNDYMKLPSKDKQTGLKEMEVYFKN